MRIQMILMATAGTMLLAQATTPAIKWRGSLWASAVTQNRQSTDGSLWMRPVDAGEDTFSLDGLSLGADVDLGKGWSVKATLLGGHAGKLLNTTSGETGTLAIMEGQLVWTGEKDTIRFGRMNTFLGMEYLDGAQDITASRGLLFSFADPFGQVGLAWRHAFTSSWSTDLFVFNGEDRVKDNNRSKTLGVAVNYNHGGALDKYVSVHVYRGPEQDGLGESANQGSEGRMRERAAMMGQWVWGGSTLQWEVSLGRERFADEVIQGEGDAAWGGAGFIFRQALTDRTGLFARAEYFQDPRGVRLSGDTSIAAAYGSSVDAHLKASSFALGVDHKYGAAFARLEVRQDHVNKEVTGLDDKRFSGGLSGTLCVGASF